MSEPLISIRNLSKKFGGGGAAILAVNGVTFDVRAGEVVGFLGPNGAGKSTTMKMVTGYLRPTSGAVRVCGLDVQDDPIGVKERIGYLPEGAPAYPDMTPASFLSFAAEVRGLGGAARADALARAVERTQLQGVLRQPIDTLSKGFKRRVGLAQAILHEPPVLIMDEPTDGLDPNQKHEVRKLIREMAGAGGRAIVLSTHILEEVDAVCTRAIVIARGRVVADTTPAALAARSRYHGAVTLCVIPLPGAGGGAGAGVFEELARVPGVASVENTSSVPTGEGVRATCTLIPATGADLASAAGQFVRARNWRLETLRVEGGRLDDVFRDLTAGAGGDGGAHGTGGARATGTPKEGAR
ncbi:MAG: ABC transporter ATP-binding protein [Planctomycetota bacterium]|nr:ABC transporter ATP-binding protein [Planctomycetota bacterium]